MIHFLAAIALAAQQCPAGQGADTAICMALQAQQTGEFAKSAEEFERAAGMVEPGDPAGDRMLAAAGNMWIAAGENGKAALALDRALAGTGLLADQRGAALLDRARAAEAQGDLTTARSKLDEAATSIGDDPFFWYFSSALAIREGKADVAKASINRALAMAPNDADILFEAGHAYHFAGELDAARGYWRRAVEQAPDSTAGKAAAEALQLLDTPKPVEENDKG